jgi:predicted RNA binding protein YcfA (HicA-like mRNA interferase family)
MTPKLPVISGDDLIRALGKFGYVAVRQKGSHVRLRHPSDPSASRSRFRFTKKSPPAHFAAFLRDASLTVDQLLAAL